MAPVTNGRVIFNDYPSGYPEPGKTTIYDSSETIDPDAVPLNGGILLKVLYLSIDPYMRGRMRPPTTKSYAAGFTLGQPTTGFGVGLVVRSENPGAKPGDHISGFVEHKHYVIIPNLENHRIIDNKYNLPWSYFIGVCGMPGMTAYAAWKKYASAKKGEVAFVSTGAGPVGSFVIQLAKLDGLKVIGSAGSDEKAEYMKSIGADVVINYKKENIAEVLEREGPIDIYWDNVGGETLDAALNAAATNARFIECGMIAGYNTGGQPIKNLFQVVSKSISMFGFIILFIEHEWREEFYNTVPELVAKGQLKYREHVWDGLETVGEVILAVQKGDNRAKAVIKVADE